MADPNISTGSTSTDVVVKYKYFVGTKKQYNKLVALDLIKSNYIIFVTDTVELYKGLVRYSTDNFKIVDKQPTEPLSDVIYCVNGELMYYNENQWIAITKPVSIKVNSKSTDSTLPTAKACYDAIVEQAKTLGEEINKFKFIVEESGTIKWVKDEESGKYTAQVKVSTQPRNKIVEKDDGLYVNNNQMTVDTIHNLPTVGDENVLYIVKRPNSIYRWDSTDLKYYCVGRDYNDITCIDGNA